MKNLLKLHFHNLFKQKSFYVCAVLIILTGLSTIFIPMIFNYFMHKSIDPLKINTTLRNVTDVSNYSLLLAILLPLFLTLDVSNNTLKNIIARGFSREKVFISSYITSIIVSTFIYFIMLFLGFIATLLFGKMDSLTSKTIITLLINYLSIIGITSVYCLISNIVSKASGALIICILVNTMASTVLNLTDTLLSLKMHISISGYWIESLSPSKPIISILVGLVYIVGCFVIGLNLSNQKEVK